MRKAVKKRKLFPSDDSAKKGGLSGDTASLEKVDDADQKLKSSLEPIINLIISNLYSWQYPCAALPKLNFVNSHW